MVFIQKNSFLIRWISLILLVIGLSYTALYFVSFKVIPTQLAIKSNQFCLEQLEDRSYQIKQFVLENVSNSKYWAQNPKNSFFDPRWFAVSFYEFERGEWALKDFRVNNMSLELYKILHSDYIKMELALAAPHPYSEQISVHSEQVKDVPLTIIEAPNHIEDLGSKHMLRIAFNSDILNSILNTNSQCQLNLLDTQGNFLFSQRSTSNISKIKILKNLFITTQNQFNAHLFKISFLVVFMVSLFVTLGLTWISVTNLRKKFLTKDESSHLKDELTRKNLS